MPSELIHTRPQYLFHKTLVIDIETVPQLSGYEELPESTKELWQKKSAHFKVEDEQEDVAYFYEKKAGIFAEFGKIVCICIGYIDSQKKKIIIKSIHDNDENILLTTFINIVSQFNAKNKDVIFCGHNIKEFDLPYICRRCIVHNIKLPSYLQLSGRKPWEINHLDTLELWKFGDYKHYTSLDLLAHILKIPSSKTDMAGDEVAEVYWKEKNINRISKYCMQDVFTTALVFMRLISEEETATYSASYVE